MTAVVPCRGGSLEFGRRTLVMGILNVTPDSFSGDGVWGDPDERLASALERARAMVADGADVLDIGGESTRPGAAPVPLDEELARVVPVIEAVAGELRVLVSVDTTKARVAERALEAGAAIVNDVSALRDDPAMADVVRGGGAAVVLMHRRGTPLTMQQLAAYDDVVTEVAAFLRERVTFAASRGIPEERTIVDPGFGFAKTADHNLELVRRLGEIAAVGRPVLVGPSRKSTIGQLLGGLAPAERVEGTMAWVAVCIAHGADMVRVHDVREMTRLARVADAVARGWEAPRA